MRLSVSPARASGRSRSVPRSRRGTRVSRAPNTNDSVGISEYVGRVFFFQAEDGIRDYKVTGVQTCALPIMSAIAEGASYKRIQQDESRVRQLSGAARELGLAEIAEQFDRFAREFTRSRYADEALLSAALIYSEIGRVDAAMEVCSWMAERYGKSEHAPRNTLLYAELHERIADFERAARIYHQFAHDHPSHAEAPRALKQAGLHYAAAGKNEQAKAAFERFASLYPREPDAAPVRLRACDIDLDLKRWRSAERCYAKAGSSVRALSGRGEALSRMKRAKAAPRLFASAVASYERLSQDEKGGEVRTAA